MTREPHAGSYTLLTSVLSIKVILANEPGALGDFSNIIARAEGNIANLNITNRTLSYFELMIDVEVRDLKHLNDIIAAVKASKMVSYAARAN